MNLFGASNLLNPPVTNKPLLSAMASDVMLVTLVLLRELRCPVVIGCQWICSVDV